MEWKDEAKLEGLITRLVALKEEEKSFKARKEVAVNQVINELERQNKAFHTFILNEKQIEVVINMKHTNTLERKKLAELLSVEPKFLKTKFMIEKAAKGELTSDDYESCHVSSSAEELKLKIKKVKPKKEPKTKKQ